MEDGINGVLARTASPFDFANALSSLATDPGLIDSIRHNLAAQRERTMDTFLDELLNYLLSLRNTRDTD